MREVFMAGTVAKIPVHKFSHVVDPVTVNGQRSIVSDSGKMDEEEILAQLQDDSYSEERAHVLDELTKNVRRLGGRLSVENRHALYRGLAFVLADQNWDVRLKCIQLICELVPQFGSELDSCMKIVLPQLVNNLGDSKVAVRKSVIQTLHVYMKHTTNVQQIFSALVKYGIESDNPKIRAEATINLPVLLTPEFANVDLSNITHSLAQKFSNDEGEVRTADISLDRIRSLVGDSKFERYVKEMSPSVRSAYARKSSRPVSQVSVDINPTTDVDINSNRTKKEGSVSRKSSVLGPGDKLEFGIIPKKVMAQLLNQDSWNVRAKGVGELKIILQQFEDTSVILPHMLSFIGFLCNLVDDMNFKVTLETLHILEILVTKLSVGVKPYLKPLVSALAKRFGDNKVVIQQANIKVLMQLMQILTPKPVVGVVADSLKHRKSGVREEALNIIITSLLTFPSYDFDLAQVCDDIAPTLGDPKRRVRQAALEAFAVLAQAMGPSRIAPLIHAVDQVELNMDEEGVMKAVQARLARRQLPRIDDDGLVKYASNIPSSASSRGAPNLSADTIWILKGTGSASSARERSHTEPGLELSQISPTKTLPGGQDTSPPKRFYSAGRGRSKLPWEEDRDSRSEDLESSMNRPHASSAPLQNQKLRRDVENHPPLKARPTWDAGEQDVWDHGNSTNGKFSQRRAKSLQSIAPKDPVPEPGGGSYRQIHLDKLKRASIATYPGRRPSPSDDGYPGSYSAPNTDRGGGPDPFMGSAGVIPKKRMSVRQDADDSHRDWKQGYGNEKYGGYSGVNGKDDGRARMSLSNSWPDSGFGTDDAPRGKKTTRDTTRHEPSSQYSTDWSPNTDPSPKKSTKSGPAQSPVPMKAQLARSAGRRGQRATLDPIEKSMGRDEMDEWNLDVKDNITFELSDDEEEDSLQMTTSLQNVRSSAAKKRAQKMASQDSTKSYNRSNGTIGHAPDPQESGFFSMFSTLNPEVEDSLERYPPANNIKKKGKRSTADSPFSNKPRIARSSSGRGSRKNSSEQPEDLDPNGYSSYNPSSDTSSSDVSIVGQGYSKTTPRDSDVVETWRSSSPPIPTHRNQNAREKKRQQRPSGSGLVSPLGMASLHHPGATETDDTDGDFNMVVGGKGMFGHSEAVVTEYPSAGQSKHRSRRGDQDGPDSQEPLPGVVGYSYHDNGYGKEQDEYGLAMSKATKDRIARKQLEKQLEKKEEIEQQNAERKAEKERRLLEIEQRNADKKAEKERRMQELEERKMERERRQQEAEERNADRERRQKEELEILNAEKAKRQQEEQEQRIAERERRQQQREARQKAVEKEREEKEAKLKVLDEERKKAKERDREERELRQKAMEEERKRARDDQRERLRQLQLEKDQRAADLAIEATRPSSLSITGGVQYPSSGQAYGAIEDTLTGVTPEEASSYSNGTDDTESSDLTSPNSARVFSKPPLADTPKKKKAKTPNEWKSGGKILNRSISGSSQSSSSIAENGEVDEVKPCANPDGALKDALRFMGHSDWEVKIDGLSLLRRLAVYHPEQFHPQMHTIIVAVLTEIKNLRSSVARSAISRLGDMFEALKQGLDKDLDAICKTLLPKAGESNGFIREDVDKTLHGMVMNATASRVLISLINTGGSHKNAAVRKTTAQFLERTVDRMGPGRVLSGVKDVTDKLLPTVAKFALDSAQETRYYGRKTLYSLMHHEDFDRLLDKHVPAKDLKPLRGILETLRIKGLGDVPTDTSSARARRSQPNSRAPSGNNNPAGRDKVDSGGSDYGPRSGKRTTKKSAGRLNETTQESINTLCKSLSASDWTTRLQGIESFQEMCETNTSVVTSSIVKIFDNFNPRITDSNSKVNLAALQCLHSVVPILGEHLAAITTNITPLLAGNLASKNNNICQTSQDILDLIMKYVELNVLVQPFANATQYGNARTKPIMVDKLAILVRKVYPRKQQTIIRHVLPVLWYLLGNMTGSGTTAGGTGSIRGATALLANTLYEMMGENLFQHSASLPPRHKNMLKELINSSL